MERVENNFYNILDSCHEKELERLDERVRYRILGTGGRYVQGFVRETWRKEKLGRPTRRWKDNIKANLKGTGWQSVDWFDLAKNRDKDRAFVNEVVKVCIP